MQLQLIPYSPHPAILFAFTLPVLPSTLPFPAAYASQLQLLLNTDLDPPPSPYALDKAVWAVHLIELVIFDLPKLTVSVKMVDGTAFEWTMTGEQALLLQVQHDVQQSTREAEKEKKEDLDAAVRAAASAAYLPLTNPIGVDASPRREESQERAPNGRTAHRRSKSLFNSLLSALSLASSSSSSTSQSYRIGGGSLPPMDQPQDVPPLPYHDFDILAFSTSEYNYPVRPQLAIKSLPASRALRRRARSALVDCFRRWVIPTVRERLQWGSFAPYDAFELVKDGGGTKWGKMSKATNAYADWACRSMVRRCESTLTELLPPHNSEVELEKADAESRRSSASSALISAISGSSRASTSPDHAPLSELDLDGFPEPLITATLRTSRMSGSSDATSFTITQDIPPAMRRVAYLRSSLDRFKDLHDMLGAEARAAADGHDFALRALEERVRRRAWSSTETAAVRRSPLSTRHDTAACRVSTSSVPSAKACTFSAANTAEFGTGRSIWEFSIPIIRSSLGEISSTWDDWQMEWEMEKDFDDEEREEAGFGLEGDSFPTIISDIEDISFPTESEGLTTHHRSISLGSGTETETGGNGGHSEFSDSSDEEDGTSTSTDDASLSPTSPRGFVDSNPQRTPSARRGRGRRTGVKARIGTYEDVRDEMPPSPPLVALSPPPPRVKTGQAQSKSGESGNPASQGTAPGKLNEHSTDGANGISLRPPRATRPAHLELNSNRKESPHRREPASSSLTPPSHGASLARTRLAGLQSSSGLYDDWEVDTDAEFVEESTIFLSKSNDIQELFELSGATNNTAVATAHSTHQRRYLAGIQKAMQEN
ncbi:hypothetical protein FRC16_003973, partial [Serendipita sp. 398]